MVSVDVETHGVVQIFVAAKRKKPIRYVHILLPGDILKNKIFKNVFTIFFFEKDVFLEF